MSEQYGYYPEPPLDPDCVDWGREEQPPEGGGDEMSEHTPGPCFDCGEIDSCVDGLHNDRWVRCLACRSEGPVRPTEAEAVAAWNVLSAAPDLLAACEAVAVWVETDDLFMSDSLIDEVQAAIRAARGGE